MITKKFIIVSISLLCLSVFIHFIYRISTTLNYNETVEEKYESIIDNKPVAIGTSSLDSNNMVIVGDIYYATIIKDYYIDQPVDLQSEEYKCSVSYPANYANLTIVHCITDKHLFWFIYPKIYTKNTAVHIVKDHLRVINVGTHNR